MTRSLRNGRNFGVRLEDFKVGVGKIMETRFVNGLEFFGGRLVWFFFFFFWSRIDEGDRSQVDLRTSSFGKEVSSSR